MEVIKTLSVLIDGKTITDKNSANTFVELINYLSNKISKEKLAEDFPKIFSKSEFINPKTNKRYTHRVDDSGEYLIYTNTNNDYKKSILENIYKKYNIDIEVSIIEESVEIVEDTLLSDIKILLQNSGNIPMTSDEIFNRLKRKDIEEVLSLDIFDKITTDKTRYRLSNYLPTKLVDSIKAYDFITMEMLVEILGKSGVNVNI
jgi:hypothetical protein